jgi:hypothetical protein
MTISPLPKEPLPIRLVFKLERAEHPRLYDELFRFRKDAKRVNRLRLLAYDGLLVQHGLLKLPWADPQRNAGLNRLRRRCGRGHERTLRARRR